MSAQRYVVMGAGEVGCHLSMTLSGAGHHVTMIDSDETKRQLVEEQLDVAFVHGNGAEVPTLEAAGIDRCDLFVAASSSDEANLAASLLAKGAGAARTVVRVASSEGVTRYGRIYERTFQADLLLSTQLLTTTRILNAVLGYNTLDIEYLAGGALQVRRTEVEAGSQLHERRLAEVDLPRDCLVLAYISGDGELIVPSGGDRAKPGDAALVIATADAIDEVERRISGHARKLGMLVIAGGGASAVAVASELEHQARTVKIIEADRARAEELAARFPQHEIIHGDATDMSVLAAENVGRAKTFIALTGHDETNLMACLLAEELGARKISALVRKSETSSLWRKVGLLDVVSPRMLAAERIQSYIDANYEPSISIENGAARFLQRVIAKQSPAAGGRLADVEVPQGLVIAAVLKGGRAIIPRGDHRLQVGDEVILFARAEEVGIANLLFPGRDVDDAAPR